MSQKYLIRIAELERLLSEQAEALRQKDQQLSLVEETEAFLRSALARAEEKIEEDEREIEHLRAQIEKLHRMLFGTRSEKLRREVELAEALLKQREQDSDRYSCVFRSIRSRIGIEVRSAIRIHSINRELNLFYRFLTRFFAAFHCRGIFPQGLSLKDHSV